MPNIVSSFRRGALTSLAVCLLTIVPLGTSTVAFADDCTPPAQNGSGVHWPTGSDAGTFTYQCDGQYQGMWTNAHYIYDPVTSSRSPKDTPIYTYNNATGMWDTTQWDYSSPKGDYVADTVSVQTPPAGATTVGGPAPVASIPSSGSNQANNANTPGNAQTAIGGGSSSTNLNGNNNTNINNATNATMTNGVSSLANSGNATISYGTLVGSATSGAVQNEANIINMLQSTSNVLGAPGMLTFTANINGDVNGDILLDPAHLSSIQPANTNANLNNDVTLNNSNDASINNDINLGSTSGNATIDHSTVAGDATTGNAQTVANITNILNSAVNAGRSFVGIININGNLNGDILLPPNFIDTLLASNVPRYTIDSSALNTTNNVTNNANQSINNNVNESAASGNVTSTNNTDVGNATSGSAKANLTVFNLTGSSLVASNDIMVFVNNMGSWYGMILNAPAGATAASLGGGVSSNTTATDTSTLNNNANQSINNNINVNAKSGNAKITDSTKVGNATSGNANASVTLVNMINDRLSLTGWFGLLFINVFGSWTGSFGINTSAGDPITTGTPAAGASGGSGVGSGSSQMFQFVPKATTFSNKVYLSNGSTANTSGDASTNNLGKASVLAAQTVKSPADTLPQLAQSSQSYLLPIMGVGLAIVIILAGERNRFFHHRS